MDDNLEMLAAKLELMNGNDVVLIRPSFGSQSDSWVGTLLVYDNVSQPIKLQVCCNNTAKIFTLTDIKSTEFVKETSQLIIRLKGPQDYQ